MYASLQEKGERPLLLTPARMNAPQGARVIVDMLANEDFADICQIVIDWEGDMAWDESKGPMPQELRTPVLYFFIHKWYPEIDRRVELEFALDLDDAFQQDNFDNNVAAEIVQYMKEEFDKKRDELDGGRVH